MHSLRTSRRSARVARSQLATRLGLALYAALTTIIALRCLVLFLSLPASVSSVSTILAVSSPVVWPFRLLPVAERAVLGSATLADLTAVLILVALPLPFLGRRPQTT
ncbi:MAG: hypothetical protein KC442_06680 [Thermomicrobiales bacterium]|nr:hypothetical protein [Thermomicrobiales bacterium]